MDYEVPKASDDPNKETPHINPLHIPLVVDKILSYLPPRGRDIWQSRLVCRHWASSASAILRVHNDVRVGEFCTDVSKFDKFLDIVQDGYPASIPVSKFVFCHDIFDPENEPLLKKFFQVFSQSIESLALWFDLKSTFRFSQDCFISSPEFQNMQFPRLKYLGFDDRRAIKPDFGQTGPLFLGWLLKGSPNLEDLVIHYDRELEKDGSEKSGYVNEMIVKSFSETRLRALKSLKFDLHIDNNILDCLSKFCRVSRLTSLQIGLRRSSFDKEALGTLLTTLTYSLKELRFTLLSKESECRIQFPRMEALELLEIAGWNSEYPNVHFDRFCYSAHLPRLKALLMESWTGKDDWWQFLRPKDPVLTVNKLKIPAQVTTVDNIRNLIQVFPNLEKLELTVSEIQIGVLEIVFANLSELTDLKINYNSTTGFWEGRAGRPKNADSLFTGISPEGCDMIRQSGYLNHFPIVPDLKAFRQKPGITNLKKLRRFKLKDLECMAEITDVTGYLAFMCMESLEYLDVECFKMSPECTRQLVRKFPQNMSYQSTVPRLGKCEIVDINFNPPNSRSEAPGRCSIL